ncbi:MAG TPA: glycosyltransferase family 4 protein [Gemmatimonadaceae bacterium]|jgi:glycosyltransferase involved in cell wall biosynthesis
MRAGADVLRVALPCTGLGRQHRGFETITRETHAALRATPGLSLRVFGGGGALREDEQAVWNLSRDSRLAQWVAAHTRYGAYFVEQATFFAGFLPSLLAWRPHVVYYADLNFGNACWHWRRVSGQRFRLLYYNSGPTTQPYTRCDFVQQVTPAQHDAALARGESADRMCLLPHGLALPSAPPARSPELRAATRRAFRAPDNKPLLLSVGMLGSTLKRMDVLVNAVAALGAERPHLVILGQETPETAALREQAAAQLGDGAWIGTWPRDRISDAYAAADAFALLSLSEGFGLAYIEALAAGLPCVVYDSANTAFILGEHAYRGDTSSPAGTAALLRRALSETTTETIRRARWTWVRDRFSWDVLAPRYVEMLRACAVGQLPAWSRA